MRLGRVAGLEQQWARRDEGDEHVPVHRQLGHAVAVGRVPRGELVAGAHGHMAWQDAELNLVGDFELAL